MILHGMTTLALLNGQIAVIRHTDHVLLMHHVGDEHAPIRLDQAKFKLTRDSPKQLSKQEDFNLMCFCKALAYFFSPGGSLRR